MTPHSTIPDHLPPELLAEALLLCVQLPDSAMHSPLIQKVLALSAQARAKRREQRQRFPDWKQKAAGDIDFQQTTEPKRQE